LLIKPARFDNKFPFFSYYKMSACTSQVVEKISRSLRIRAFGIYLLAMPLPTVLLIEDDENISEPLIYGLQKEGMTVLLAENGSRGLDLARRERPNLILLDVMLPDLDGFTICRTLRGELDTPILMLTARGQEMDRVMGLELGADDYIIKPFNFRELVARIHAALRRHEMDRRAALTPNDRLAIGEITLDRAAHRVWRGDQLVELTPREFDLLAVLMEHAGQATPRQDLLDQVWGKEWVGDPRTLDVHIRGLREKMEEPGCLERYIETVRGYGYRFVDPTARR
jgi:DNA-binding response OmpR family regulator